MSGNKHDISANVVKLDFAQLKQAVLIAVCLAKNECERNIGAIQNTLYDKTESARARNLANYAARLASNADSLKTASETLHALTESESRDTLAISNQIKNKN